MYGIEEWCFPDPLYIFTFVKRESGGTSVLLKVFKSVGKHLLSILVFS